MFLSALDKRCFLLTGRGATSIFPARTLCKCFTIARTRLFPMSETSSVERRPAVFSQLFIFVTNQFPKTIACLQQLETVLVAHMHQIQHVGVCNDIHTLCMCNYIHTTHTRRAFVRNLLVVGFPSAMVLRPDLFFAASLDSRRDSLLDAALHTFPFLRHLGVRY